MGHLSESDLEGFESSALAPPALRRVVLHLLSGCAACGSKLFAAEWHGAADHEAAIERTLAFARNQNEHWKQERERRDRGLALVRAKGWKQMTPSERRSLRGGWAEVEILLEISGEARYRDTREMLRFAQRAKTVAERLDPEIWESGCSWIFAPELRPRWAMPCGSTRISPAPRPPSSRPAHFGGWVPEILW